ncbi:MAG: excinuclease ABC subunit UvrA [Bacteroidales bacterium]|jgi:excinuclease ABC subunit A|nr:excinuclease ABC subunit UvrA [Bacteroidales bacterium]MDY0333866.1 excinuclease ABC subunit UvrA [Bacteroidales bacterium]
MSIDTIETLDAHKFILIKGARVHNLKNIDVAIARNQLIVITGLSGSGKSSLAFDTLYADGQRRYVESLSAYARQFLGRMHKPEVDYIKGISPAIAIQQKVNVRNPRSTVGTSTEIYEYLKLLFARIGHTISPVSGQEVVRHSVTDVVNFVVALPVDTRVLITSCITSAGTRKLSAQLTVLLQQGFTRLLVGEEIIRIEDIIKNPELAGNAAEVEVVIDRLVVTEDNDLRSRVADSVQIAFYEGKGRCFVKVYDGDDLLSHEFSNKFEIDGITFEEPSENLFSFNNPFGACKRCEGFGNVIGIDEDLVIPNKSLSVYEGAVAPWKGEKMGQWREWFVMAAPKFNFPVHKPYSQLTQEQRNLLWTGNKHFEGIDEFFRQVEEQTYKIQYRVMLSRYRGKTICPECRGTRLRKDAQYVRVDGHSISDLVLMPLDKLLNFFENIHISDYEIEVARRLLMEIKDRLGFLCDVGLSYLTLNRLSSSLSGGESQRINLATSLGSSLVGSMYILDEPSIGLHPRDTQRLIRVLQRLKKLGNTVIVVEHDEDIMRQADQIVDIGPLAGVHGGEVVFSGTLAELLQNDKSLTAKYLNGKLSVPVPSVRRKSNDFIEATGCRENNLKNISVKIPLNIFTVITGVSGSGKSSLVRQILYPAIKRHLGGYSEKSGKYDVLQGDLKRIQAVEFVDQNPIGRSSRSNPATYVKAYDEIRALYANQQLARVRGYKPGFFSFNIEGGRCEECEGEGVVKIEMQFMADIFLTCEACGGKRFKDEVLDVKFKDKNIADILDMTINQAVDFFGADSPKASATEKRIMTRMQPLQDVGLGYLKLGQSSSTLSGGEAQRIKLASFLTKGANESLTLFFFDEPTTGLHFHDISKLLEAFNALIANGHTIVVIEHNPEIIKSADHIIDLGPEGGEQGGYVVFEGTPEELVKAENSYTGRFLSNRIKS